MQPFSQGSNQIGIVGLGLIGGSLALDLQNLGYKVFGVTSRKSTAKKAEERGLAQTISTDPSILSNCSLIILALPLSELINPKNELINSLPKQAVITDVGSVKTPIQSMWSKIHPRFIPSHPMAGTAKVGVEAAQRNLFKSHPWITTPSKETDLEALEIVHNLAISLGSHVISIDSTTHDQAVALISHLPIVISAALLKTIAEDPNNDLVSLAMKMASSGFADTTRVGGGNPQLGVDIATYNTRALLNSLDAYRRSIDELERLIKSRAWDQLQKELEKSQVLRPEFLIK